MNVTDANLSNEPKWLNEYDVKVSGKGFRAPSAICTDLEMQHFPVLGMHHDKAS